MSAKQDVGAVVVVLVDCQQECPAWSYLTRLIREDRLPGHTPQLCTDRLVMSESVALLAKPVADVLKSTHTVLTMGS